MKKLQYIIYIVVSLFILILGIIFTYTFKDFTLRNDSEYFDTTKGTSNYKPFNQLISKAIFINNQYIILDYNGTIITSSNGEDWVSRKISSKVSCDDIAYNGKTYVIVGAYGQTIVSNDLIKWHELSTFNNITNPNIIYDGKQFIIYGEDLDRHTNEFYTSDEGLTWNKKDNVFLPHNLLKKEDTYYCTNEDGLFSSNDTILWSKIDYRGKDDNKEYYFSKLIWNGNHFLGVYEVGINKDINYILNSTDGVNWNKAKISTPYHIEDIVWFKDKFILVNNDNELFTSVDGDYWTKVNTGYSFQGEGISSIVCSNDNIIAVGNYGTLLKSQDGVVWTQIVRGKKE